MTPAIDSSPTDSLESGPSEGGGRTPVSTLSERKRQLVRNELSRAALGLLAKQGFEATTIDQIVDLAGVSRRTFLRYFQSKEDVFIEFMGDIGSEFSVALAQRPLDEALSSALRAALPLAAGPFGGGSERALLFAQLTRGTPALHARYLERQIQWRDTLSEILRQRSGGAGDPLAAPLAAAMTLAAFDTALGSWVDSGGSEDFIDLVDRAFALIGPWLDSILESSSVELS